MWASLPTLCVRMRPASLFSTAPTWTAARVRAVGCGLGGCVPSPAAWHRLAPAPPHGRLPTPPACLPACPCNRRRRAAASRGDQRVCGGAAAGRGPRVQRAPRHQGCHLGASLLHRRAGGGLWGESIGCCFWLGTPRLCAAAAQAAARPRLPAARGHGDRRQDCGPRNRADHQVGEAGAGQGISATAAAARCASQPGLR